GRRAARKSVAVSWPEMRKQEPVGRWPAVEMKTPPSRFQTVRLGPLPAFSGFSSLRVLSSMRDCRPPVCTVERKRSVEQKSGLARRANISWSRKRILAQEEDGGGGKRSRRPDR